MSDRLPNTPAMRFALKCRKATNGCVEWTGGKTSAAPGKGYGVFYVDAKQRMRSAHRYAFEQVYGPVPAHLDVCHKCDNRLCVRVDHLFVGTRLENMQDCVAKGRQKKGKQGPAPWKQGENNPLAKLNAAAVREIRDAAYEGETGRDLAIQYGISEASVSNVINRKTWSHL